MQSKWLLLLCLTIGLSACAQTVPKAGEVMTLQGRLTLKGSMPMAVPVLMTDEHGQWELRGLSRQQISTLQSRSITVVGKVLQPAVEGATLPRLDVQDVR